MPELLSVMKDVASLLEKQDTTQERAKLDKPPKTGDGQKPLIGGAAPGFKPGEGIAKEYPQIPKRISPQEETTEVNEGGASLLKEDEGAEEGEAYGGEETPEEEAAEAEEAPSEEDELKSLLKSIAFELSQLKKSSSFSKADMQKAVRTEADSMLRKMGFHPSRPDITKLNVSNTLGVDQTADIKKSEDKLETDVKKSAITNIAGKDLSGLSWRELGAIREGMGGFNPFAK